MPKYFFSRGVRRAKRALTGLSGISRLRSTIPTRQALARDLAGQFPLFLAQSGDRTGFASMPSGLRSFIGQPDLNKQRLALTLCDVGHDDYHSHFAKVERVLPGEIVRIGKGEISRRFFWHGPSRSQHRNGRDWVEEYRQTLDAAVADRCRGFAPIATHLQQRLG